MQRGDVVRLVADDAMYGGADDARFYYKKGWYGRVLAVNNNYGYKAIVDFGEFAKHNAGYYDKGRLRTTSPHAWEPEVKAMNPSNGTWRMPPNDLEVVDPLRAAWLEMMNEQ